jgi:hypothetical protein
MYRGSNYKKNIKAAISSTIGDSNICSSLSTSELQLCKININFICLKIYLKNCTLTNLKCRKIRILHANPEILYIQRLFLGKVLHAVCNVYVLVHFIV